METRKAVGRSSGQELQHSPSGIAWLLAIGLRYWVLVSGVTSIVVAISVGLTLTSRPMYEAVVRMLIAQPQLSSVTAADLPVVADVIGATRARSIQTHAEQVRSASEVRAALDALPRDLRPVFPARASAVDLDVSPIAGTDVVRIRVRAPNPKAAAALANALADVHVKLAQAYNQSAASQAAEYVRQQSEEEARLLSKAQNDLLEYHKGTGIYDHTSERAAAMTRLLEVRKQLEELEVTLAGVNASLASLSKQVERQPSSLASETVQKLEEEAARLRAEQQSALASKRELLSQRTQVEQALRRLDQQSYDVERLDTEVNAHKETYEKLAKQYRDLLVSSAARLPNVSVFSPAQVPTLPVPQHRFLKLLLALIVGSTLGLLAALTLERLQVSGNGPR